MDTVDSVDIKVSLFGSQISLGQVKVPWGLKQQGLPASDGIRLPGRLGRAVPTQNPFLA